MSSKSRQFLPDCSDCQNEIRVKRTEMRKRAKEMLRGCRTKRLELGIKANSDEWQDEFEFEVERVAHDVLALLKATGA